MMYLILVILVVGILVAFLYNNLIQLRNKVEEAWADISTQLKRRYDLIPNLVETVKGYAAHESQTFEKVTAARTAAMNAQGIHDKEMAENELSGTLKSIFALAENYPDLKANQNFLDLQKTLTEVEDQLQLSRRYYNATVRDFNNSVQMFPNSLLAKPLGFTSREFFQATDEEKKNVQVSFADKVAGAAGAVTSAAKTAADTAKAAADTAKNVASTAKNTTVGAVNAAKTVAGTAKETVAAVKPPEPKKEEPKPAEPPKPAEAPKPTEPLKSEEPKK